MEYLDILDEHGKPLNKIVERKEAHDQGLYHRVVHIWIVNHKNEVLLQKRSARKKAYPNMWGMSCEGHISTGQTSLEGAQRELDEELGLTIAPDEIRYLATIKWTMRHDDSTIANHFFDDYLIRKDIDLKNITIQEEELSEVKWMPLTEYLQVLKNNDPDYRPYPEEVEILQKALEN